MSKYDVLYGNNRIPDLDNILSYLFYRLALGGFSLLPRGNAVDKSVPERGDYGNQWRISNRGDQEISGQEKDDESPARFRDSGIYPHEAFPLMGFYTPQSLFFTVDFLPQMKG